MNHIAPKFGLAGVKGSAKVGGGAEGVDEEEAEEERSVINQLVLTVLDLTVEAHDTHHPIATEKYYEDQIDAAKARSASFRANRLPKYLKHFQNVLASNPQNKDTAGATYLIGSTTTTADLALFQVRVSSFFPFASLGPD